MKLTFVGADHEVTGSCHYLEAAGKKILIDYGMEQGRDVYENIPLPVKPSDVDYVFLTHAHIDHSGNLPLLPKRGFAGAVYATEATTDLCGIMLLDSAHIQEFEAEWRSRKLERLGKDAWEPPYTAEDAEAVLKKFRPVPYGKIVDVCEGIRIRFTDVGHLLGSAAIEVWAEEDGTTRKIVFSGDLGNIDQPILKDPDYIDEADYVLVESTYGDRLHEEAVNYAEALAEVIQRTFDRGGNVVVPSFAVGRTQEILYFIRKIKQDHLVHGHEGFKVYVDSPLAIKATTIFADNYDDCYDEEALELIKSGVNPISFQGLTIAESADESKAINAIKEPKVIISASGMCEAGRIKHHLKHNLWRPESTVLFVGYQAEGTLGRLLLDGRKEVKLFGETIAVEAEICHLPGVSGHADQAGLLRWLSHFKPDVKKVFVVHGDADVVGPFSEMITKELGFSTLAPYSGTQYDLSEDVCVYEAEPVPIEKKTPGEKTVLEPGFSARPRSSSEDYKKLRELGNRLNSVIRRSEGHPNKELRKFAQELEQLCARWDYT